MRVGPSNIYRRLLAGQVTPERYVAVVKRAVEMRFRIPTKERATARSLEQNPRLAVSPSEEREA